MNGMLISLIPMYVLAAVVLAICILRDMHRSILRAGVSLGLTMLAIPLAILLTNSALDPLVLKALYAIGLDKIVPLAMIDAFPSLEQSIVALVHMMIAPAIYLLVFWTILGILALIGHFVCRAIEQKKPELAKRSKPIGAAVGVVFGVVMIVAYMAPSAGYTAQIPYIMHALGEYEPSADQKDTQMVFDELASAQEQTKNVSETFLLKAVRAMGGEAIFRATTETKIDGVKTDLHTEIQVLDALSEKVADLATVPVKEYGQHEYDTIKDIADVIEPSELLRVLSAEGLSSLSRAWLNDEAFLGIEKPTDDAATEVAINVVLKRFANTTKETVVEDIRKMAPSVVAAIKAYNRYSVLATQTPNEPSDDPNGQKPNEGDGETSADASITTIEAALDVLNEVIEDEETKQLAMEIAIGVIAKEMESYIVKSDSPSTGASNPGTTNQGISAVIPWLTEDLMPAETEIAQEEYDSFVEGLTDFTVSGGMNQPAEEVIAEVKSIRDEVGIDLSDELCEALVNGVLDSPYASLFQ